jgi:hypothetical protein
MRGSEIPLTRRQFLVSSTAAALSQMPPLTARHKLSGRFGIVRIGGRVIFQVDSQDVFTIDPQRFGGKPRLEFVETRDRYVARLQNAVFPGTDLRADLLVETNQTATGWNLRLVFEQMRIQFTGGLEDFLLGNAAEKSIENVLFCMRSAGPATLLIQGPGIARFDREWNLVFSGMPVCKLSMFSNEFSGEKLSIAIPLAAAPSSLLSQPAKRRTVFRMDRGAHSWTLLPDFPKSNFELEYSESPFVSLVAEVDENARGKIRSAFLAASDAGLQVATATPRERFTLPGGADLKLSLSNLKYARSQSGAEYFSGHLAESHWLHYPGVSLGLKNKPAGPSLSIQNDEQRCADLLDPALALSADLPGAVVPTVELPDSTSIPCSFGKFSCNVKKFLHFDSEHKRVCLSSPFRVRILRPKDLVNLAFEFCAMEFHCHDDHSYFTVPRGGKPDDSIVIIHFPPQSIAEECFQLPDESCGAPNQNIADKRPVKTRLAQPSRMVFQPFKTAKDRLDFKIESLLDWSQWKLKVPKLAKPPIDINGEFTPDGRIEADFICDFIDATIQTVNADKTITIDQLSKERFTRLEVPAEPASGTIVQLVTGFLAPTHLRIDDVSKLKPGQRCILSVPCKPLPNEQRPTEKPANPAMTETSIELPYRLVISPNEHAPFINSFGPVKDAPANNVELWHSSLITGIE